MLYFCIYIWISRTFLSSPFLWDVELDIYIALYYGAMVCRAVVCFCVCELSPPTGWRWGLAHECIIDWGTIALWGGPLEVDFSVRQCFDFCCPFPHCPPIPHLQLYLWTNGTLRGNGLEFYLFTELQLNTNPLSCCWLALSIHSSVVMKCCMDSVVLSCSGLCRRKPYLLVILFVTNSTYDPYLSLSYRPIKQF